MDQQGAGSAESFQILGASRRAQFIADAGEMGFERNGLGFGRGRAVFRQAVIGGDRRKGAESLQRRDRQPGMEPCFIE